ncbi:hypothetical protein COCSADRAFT_173593 [Bipolaris sorokiniana ND90Pr]|uniref:Uncharacterized protein n=1 Tax=Cochliobolus sativus (strain ND90Pr / ATCC 201652) TaxID=665912 RepID=M2R4X3_COCSN|nr:uncharacterized protein COCSADRAFT_173593 [Bipolaris sorokiniana ND90Pr]EMD62209.1 hypothetical protein COCSADRAFT_173593 [Bipolaris sorokiniana ND90Pr]
MRLSGIPPLAESGEDVSATLAYFPQLPTFDTTRLVSNTGTTDLAFHFLRNINDEVEQMESLERRLLLGRITKALQTASVDPLQPMESGNTKMLAVVSSFIRQCQVVLSPRALVRVFDDIVNYLEGLKEEAAYQESTAALPNIEDYLRVRLGTIGLRPFFTILRHTLTISTSSIKDSSSFWTSPLHSKLLDCIQPAIGLQNDIVGLSKDIKKSVRMNLVMVLLEQQHKTTSDLEAVSMALTTAVSIHNTKMQELGSARASVPVEAYKSSGDVVECGAEYSCGGTQVQGEGDTDATVDGPAFDQPGDEVI